MIRKSYTKKPENARHFEEKSSSSDSKPAQLAKIIVRGIERYIKAKDAQDREKNQGKRLDFSGERRVNRDR
jgi:hypothetical protein